ncbi:hypothetical protein GGR28_001464 [Lewinella aquimaris]|uniref:DUF2007 domain-containing protein n=1 Tax=Neolewinella aquimaris TaxID=1835722 RepID=A0A840E6L7_9BACT|nr:hypothetical protein [Neolewinella aquimaris]MBB4078847.1 hypothetical protein [Neolewinella aquimaris]
MKFIYLTEVLDLQTLTLIKLSLGREGLAYRVMHENGLNVGPYLLGGRGAIVEVAETDYPSAVALLEAEGIPTDTPAEASAFGRLHELELLTESLPLVGRWNVVARFLILALVLAGVVAVLIHQIVLR